MDVLTLIKQDHADVKKLFAEYERMSDAGSEGLAKKIMAELEAHDHAEEQTVYSPTEARVNDGKDKATMAEAFKEHAAAAQTIKDLRGLRAGDSAFATKMETLIGAVRKHIEFEEGNVHSIVRDVFDEKELEAKAAQFKDAKEKELSHA